MMMRATAHATATAIHATAPTRTAPTQETAIRAAIVFPVFILPSPFSRLRGKTYHNQPDNERGRQGDRPDRIRPDNGGDPHRLTHARPRTRDSIITIVHNCSVPFSICFIVCSVNIVYLVGEKYTILVCIVILYTHARTHARAAPRIGSDNGRHKTVPPGNQNQKRLQFDHPDLTGLVSAPTALRSPFDRVPLFRSTATERDSLPTALHCGLFMVA